MQPISFTMSMNDYGFELLSDTSLDIPKMINHELFSTKNLIQDIYGSVNSVELARRRFREIARIGGLIFTGFPGRQKKERHIQSSAQLLFEVFREYEPENLLFMQTFEEVMTFQMEESRMRESLNRIAQQKLNIQYPAKPTPFAFPLIVDRLREKISSEKLEDRIRKMTISYSK
jgi:ATP-dependent Lhr-like helicase